MTATETSLDRRLAAYESSRRRATDYLLGYLDRNGAIGPVAEGPFYYRVPWALAVSGETGAAMRVTEWIRRHMLTPDGEICGDGSPDAGMREMANTYAESIVAYGAQLLRRYDVSQPAIQFALRSQDPLTGGVYLDRARTGPNGPQLVYLTCQLGMSALLTGHPDAAQLAGRFLQRLWDEQPELPGRLYTLYTRGGGIVREAPANVTMRHVVNDGREVHEYHYNGGIAAAFLGRLYMYTRDLRWLELARAYQQFSMNSTERQFETKQVCKSAWGAAVLLLITGETRYRDWLVRLGDWFVDGQEPDGNWSNTAYLDPTPTVGRRIEVTAEFIVHLDSVIGALAASQGS
jgi:hypothetical protein